MRSILPRSVLSPMDAALERGIFRLAVQLMTTIKILSPSFARFPRETILAAVRPHYPDAEITIIEDRGKSVPTAAIVTLAGSAKVLNLNGEEMAGPPGLAP